MSPRRLAWRAPMALLALALAACGPGQSGGPKTTDAKANKSATECPPSPATPDATIGKLDGVAGKRVTKMCLYGLDGDARATAQKALRSHEGDPLDLEKVREDIGAIIKSGVVEDATISAVSQGDGVVLLYALTERPRIAEVVFEGAHVFEKEGLTGKVAMEKHRPLVKSEVHDLVAAMREEYGRRGYRSAKIEATTEKAGPNLVRLKFAVAEGPQWKIGKVAFKGNAKVPEADLRKTADLKDGAAFDEEQVDRATLAVQSLYFDRGMINVRIERANGAPEKDGATALTFTIDEGDAFRVGSIKLGKLPDADEKALVAKLKTKSKQVFNRSLVLEDVKMLKETFGARGQKVEIVPRTDVDPKKKTLDLTLDVEAAGP